MTSNLDKAFSYSVRELGLDTMKDSLGEFYDDAVKSHDAVHEFLLLTPSMYPKRGSSPSWHEKSSFSGTKWSGLKQALGTKLLSRGPNLGLQGVMTPCPPIMMI